MRGRKPKPTVLHELHGKPGKRKLNPLEPKPEGVLDEPPDWLNDEQRKDWEYALQHAPALVLTSIDRDVLAAWVVAVGLHRQASVAQQDEKLVHVLENGVQVQSGYLPIINKQAQIMVKLASELGFSPAARPRLVVKKDGKDKQPGGTFADFLAEGEGHHPIN